MLSVEKLLLLSDVVDNPVYYYKAVFETLWVICKEIMIVRSEKLNR